MTKKEFIIKSVGASINALGILFPEKAAKKAFDLFCKPRIGALRERDLDFLSSADWVDLECDGEKIQCYEWKGNGEKVLLLHGWESNSARWKNLVKSLQKADFHVIAMDAPAHGGTGSTYFHALRYAQFIEKVIDFFQPQNLVGHSVGGYAMIYFLSHQKNNIQKAVAIGSPSDLDLIFKSYAQMLGYSDRVVKALYAFFEKHFGKKVEYFKIHDFAKQLKVKGLVIHDEDDKVCKFSEGKLIAENWENAIFYPTQDLGHSCQNRKVYHKVRDFLLEKNL
jgi:pimeloyl-ACP methyl ester carboxylesterase